MNNISIRYLERSSIRGYVARQSGYLRGRVLDFGAGKPGTCQEPQPYRDLVKGDYVPFDIGDDLPPGDFDAALMTQVIQYLDDPLRSLLQVGSLLKTGAPLVMTGPTNWAEIEETDLWRFTKTGIRRLLEKASFQILDITQRAEVDIGGFKMSLGWGLVATNK